MTDRTAEVLETLRNLVKFDLRTLFDGNNSLLPPTLWPQEAALAITSITSREIWSGTGQDRTLVGIEHKLRLSDRIKALELAMREGGLLHPDRQPVTDLDQLSDRQLIERVEYLVVSGGRVDIAASWGVVSDAQIDEDFAEIVALYDSLRPGMRAKSSPAVAGERLALPAPTDPAPWLRSRPAPPESPAEPPAPIEPDPLVEPFQQPYLSRSDESPGEEYARYLNGHRRRGYGQVKTFVK